MPPLRPLWLDLGVIARRLADSDSLQVASDFDGTLTPIASHPDEVVVDSRVRSAIAGLTTAPRAHVAVLSGRRLPNLAEQLGVPGVFLAGSGGLETLVPGGSIQSHVPADHDLTSDLRAALEEWCRRYPGAWVEDKGPSLAIHYRAVPPRFRAAFCSGVRRRLAPVRSRYEVLPGKRVFEVMPGGGWGKFEALEVWRRRSGEGMLFFFGDDSIDEPVHRRVRSNEGISVAVGRRASKAFYRLSDPGEVVWFLEWLGREWRIAHES